VVKVAHHATCAGAKPVENSEWRGDGKMKFLTGKDYPWLCESCRATLDIVAQALLDGYYETDDVEAPAMMMGDRRLFCGGDHCANKVGPEIDWVD
jgi:hypothetical protein